MSTAEQSGTAAEGGNVKEEKRTPAERDALARQILDKPGIAQIKPEFILLDHRIKISEEFLSNKSKEKLEASKDGNEGETENGASRDREEGPPPSKRMRLKGRNKKRPVNTKLHNSKKMCPAVLHAQECRFGESCKFSHDIKKFMAEKPTDLGPVCINFEKFGKCQYGISCRYGKSHISEEFENIINEDLYKEMQSRKVVKNALYKELQHKLWKKKYDFEKANRNTAQIQTEVRTRVDSEKFHKEGQRLTNSGNDGETVKTETCDSSSVDTSSKTDNCSSVLTSSDTEMSDVGSTKQSDASVCLSDAEGIRLRPQEKKLIDFSNKLYLAPLTTVGNLPFRRICKGMGVDITCCEMALATNILQGQMSEWALLKRHETEDLFGVQICGAFPDTLTRCCQLINDELSVDFVDLNCGCPIDLVFKKGEGCALMGKSNKFEQVVRSMKSVLDVPLTVKLRTGIFDNKNIAHYLVPKLRRWGASLVTIHGRSREQRYTRMADWDYIDECAKLGAPMPVFGNGDLLSYEDLDACLKTSASGGMVARGALIKPWIFTEMKERRHWDISANERFDMLKNYVNFGLEHWGSDHQGVENTRRFLLEWLSFLYRYIPVGLLDQVPQKINERPPFYVGRSDLETLLSSSNCGDWIKISEMLLGPVPEEFNFLPKHKANAYK
ncbi:tRNA-dihydrouridine(47) synthase [NAD(P)(+)]-like [Mizuhopecten yessoensis]|uniref:tRNA-dihydrouridine(47) synthase [NAD(P)(+)] n=1 Tax=Mizuhopecten yessoensis TaxID=6573 RepID=A0A210QIQ6_MIZYE|nr:tRNA-dihydrouridine(47) synthase [NAD(P)(+)]-like [Mizuhopecten yessoensis]XP_021357347.1 tRNA-dihydrouridine(47) synthase [NAD(P)(+)]-like [Mizuhopecten yessoensis]XP_021357348.1 tRNA-dihydrouridine(47) synthase [NAD(P)(+)]-like [Mizuhopecten yessoensis]OWF48579.1 tRNA-dihydrouridine(47) synthase [NAD(P)(+)]-like [Mizuhopecten yessoensis]